MAGLFEQTKTFLEAEGFVVAQRRDLLSGTRRTIAEDLEYVNVWVPEDYDPTTFAPRERGYLSRFEESAKDRPSAARYFIVPTFGGLSRTFSDEARRLYNVNIRIPVQFFDTNFKWDTSHEASTAAKELRDRGDSAKRSRVTQPYLIEGTEQRGDDAFNVVRAALAEPITLKNVTVVMGPAGIGKSRLFEVLFADLHAQFMNHKTKGGPPAPRPLPLIPEYLPLADGLTVRSLLTAFLQTDFVRPLRPSAFEWMITNGFGVWMLDGLDEVIVRDHQFFDYVLDLLTRPNATKPRILICVRESVLATHAGFQEFCQEYERDIALYRLLPWDVHSIRRFAELTFPSLAGNFMATMRQHPSLNSLASIPYYCDLLGQAFRNGDLREDFSEAGLLQHALSSLIERDYSKGFVDRSLVPPDDIEAFLETIASEDLAAGFRGVGVEAVRGWAEVVLPQTLDPEDVASLTSQMVNLAPFAHASPGYVRFSQEILEHYLIGRYLIRVLENGNFALFVRQLALRELPRESIALRLVSDYIRASHRFGAVKGLVYDALAHKDAFKNLLAILTASASAPDAFRDIPFERQDLSGLHLKGLDLHEVSFRGCNLTDAEFDACNLQGADLSDAIFKNTGFLGLPDKGLRGAKVGDLSRFYSLRVGRGQIISNHGEAREWLEQFTEEKASTVAPCNAALQLRGLFNKFVYPDGTARRSSLVRRSALSGRVFHRSPDEVLESAVRHTYLAEEERFRDRIHRPEGNLYAELVGFATALRLTPGIRAVLDEVCDKEACVHVPAG